MGQRQMAIASTVKKASDTSGKEFPAPSHVSLSSQASEMAQQLSTFYSNPGMYARPFLRGGDKTTKHVQHVKRVGEDAILT